MNYTALNLKGLTLIEPRVFEDARGYFMETFHQESFEKFIGHKVNFVQDNESVSSYGVLRGMHYQTGQSAQSKLVRVIQGRVLDIVVDLRKNSETYGQSYSVELSGENKKQLFIPRGFAHGFLVLSEQVVFSYKVDAYYDPSSERGFLYNSPALDLDWGISDTHLIISPKDLVLPEFSTSIYE